MKNETTIALVKEVSKSKSAFSSGILWSSWGGIGAGISWFVIILSKLIEKNSGQELSWISIFLLTLSLFLVLFAFYNVIEHRLNKKFALIIEAILENKNS